MQQPSTPYLPRPQNSLLYYPFGSSMMSYSNEEFGYSYGMNTQERDDEIYGEGNSYTAEYWQYDARLGRRWNIDPVVKEYESPYGCFHNNPIICVDIDGDDPTTNNKKGDRSIRKYRRKFNKAQREIAQANPQWDRNQVINQAHQQVDERYKHKKWMWVRDKTDAASYGNSNNRYYHAGDLFVMSNDNANANINIVQRRELPLNASSVFGFTDPAGNMVGGRTYNLPGNGVIVFNFVSTAGNWTYNARQGMPTVINNSNDLAAQPSLTGDLIVNPANSPLQTQLNINTANGNTLFVSFIAPVGTNASRGGADANSVVFRVDNNRVVQRRNMVKPYSLPNMPGRTDGRLNREGRRILNNDRRNHFGLPPSS